MCLGGASLHFGRLGPGIHLLTLPHPVDHRELRELDNLLVQLWISRSVRPKVTYVRVDGNHEEAATVLLLGLVEMEAVHGQLSL